MITELTSAQVARMTEFRDRWTAIGLSTAPADRPTAEAAIRLAYHCAGLGPPHTIVWCGSPLSQAISRRLWRGSVRDSVGASVRGSVRDSVGASVRDSIRISVWDSIYGQHDASWLSLYDYFRVVCGLKAQTARLRGLTDLARSAGWALPHKDSCWVSERHNTLRLDDRGRLHCADGPAVTYPDGWSIYAVHGVRVSERIVMHPESFTSEELAKEPNSEVLRIIGERLGWSVFLDKIGAVVVDTYVDPDTKLVYELLDLAERKGPDQPRWLRMRSPKLLDGSEPTYVEKVHPDLTHAIAARNWQFRKPDGTWPSVKEANLSPALRFGCMGEMMKEMMKVYRHGDVQLDETELETIPDGFVIVPDGDRGVILAEGEATGHAHRLPAGSAELYRKPGVETALLRVLKPVNLQHEEHGPGPLRPMIYRVGTKRQYTESEHGCLL